MDLSFPKRNGNDWVLAIYEWTQKKVSYRLSVTRFGLAPIEIPYLTSLYNMCFFFCQGEITKKSE
jgi:hypothetical protein